MFLMWVSVLLLLAPTFLPSIGQKLRVSVEAGREEGKVMLGHECAYTHMHTPTPIHALTLGGATCTAGLQKVEMNSAIVVGKTLVLSLWDFAIALPFVCATWLG